MQPHHCRAQMYQKASIAFLKHMAYQPVGGQAYGTHN
jgi:hypothetical protein